MPDIDGWWNGLIRSRAEAVLELVLRSISDDYENVEIIIKTINEWDADVFTIEAWPARRAAPVSRREVIQSLGELVHHGYAQSYRFDASNPFAQPVDFSEREACNLWFYATPKGIEAVKRLAIEM